MVSSGEETSIGGHGRQGVFEKACFCSSILTSLCFWTRIHDVLLPIHLFFWAPAVSRALAGLGRQTPVTGGPDAHTWQILANAGRGKSRVQSGRITRGPNLYLSGGAEGGSLQIQGLKDGPQSAVGGGECVAGWRSSRCKCPVVQEALKPATR